MFICSLLLLLGPWFVHSDSMSLLSNLIVMTDYDMHLNLSIGHNLICDFLVIYFPYFVAASSNIGVLPANYIGYWVSAIYCWFISFMVIVLFSILVFKCSRFNYQL